MKGKHWWRKRNVSNRINEQPDRAARTVQLLMGTIKCLMHLQAIPLRKMDTEGQGVTYVYGKGHLQSFLKTSPVE